MFQLLLEKAKQSSAQTSYNNKTVITNPLVYVHQSQYHSGKVLYVCSAVIQQETKIVILYLHLISVLIANTKITKITEIGKEKSNLSN